MHLELEKQRKYEANRDLSWRGPLTSGLQDVRVRVTAWSSFSAASAAPASVQSKGLGQSHFAHSS